MPTTEGREAGREGFEKDDDGQDRESNEQAGEMRVQPARSNERNCQETYIASGHLAL